MNEPRVIAELPDEIGGDQAYSELNEDYTGPAKLVYEGHSGDLCAVFPSQEEANAAACMALKPDIGGYTGIRVVLPGELEHITHQTAVDWMFD